MYLFYYTQTRRRGNKIVCVSQKSTLMLYWTCHALVCLVTWRSLFFSPQTATRLPTKCRPAFFFLFKIKISGCRKIHAPRSDFTIRKWWWPFGLAYLHRYMTQLGIVWLEKKLNTTLTLNMFLWVRTSLSKYEWVWVSLSKFEQVWTLLR